MKSAGCVITPKRLYIIIVENSACLIDRAYWRALIFPISKVIIKAASWVPPSVIWSQWRDQPLIGEWLLNSLSYVGYNARPAIFINENIPNIPKHVITDYIYVYTGTPFSTNKLQEEGNNVNTLWTVINPEVIFTVYCICPVRVNTNYCRGICQLYIYKKWCQAVSTLICIYKETQNNWIVTQNEPPM